MISQKSVKNFTRKWENQLKFQHFLIILPKFDIMFSEKKKKGSTIFFEECVYELSNF